MQVLKPVSPILLWTPFKFLKQHGSLQDCSEICCSCLQALQIIAFFLDNQAEQAAQTRSLTAFNGVITLYRPFLKINRLKLTTA